MSNLTTYCLVFGAAAWSNPGLFDRAVDFFERGGYKLSATPSTPILGMSADGLQPLEFRSRPELVTMLRAHGGLVTLWKDGEALDITFGLHSHQIQFGVGHTLLPERDAALADMLGQLFTHGCVVLQPVYGYVTDEWALEAAFPGTALGQVVDEWHSALVTQGRPPLLTWRTFISERYATPLEERWLRRLTPWRAACGDGVLLELADQPWMARIAVFNARDLQYHLTPR